MTIALAQPFENLTIQKQTFLSQFQMVSAKIAIICTDFKWLGFRISDPFQNPEHLQPGFKIPTVLDWEHMCHCTLTF